MNFSASMGVEAAPLARRQESIRVLLAESDPVSYRTICSVLHDEPNLSVKSVDHGALINSLLVQTPDVVIMDVHSPAICRADSWESLGVSPPSLTIFTSYDATPVSHFTSHSTALLVKPFDADQFQEIFDLAVMRIAHSRLGDQCTSTAGAFTSSPSSRQFLQRVAIEAGEKIVLVRTTDIEWMQSSGNHIRLHIGRTSHLLRQSLKGLYALLDPSRFLRVHRNAIVNLDHVEEFHLPTLGNMFVKLRSGLCLPLRKNSRPLLRKVLTNTSLHIS